MRSNVNWSEPFFQITLNKDGVNFFELDISKTMRLVPFKTLAMDSFHLSGKKYDPTILLETAFVPTMSKMAHLPDFGRVDG